MEDKLKSLSKESKTCPSCKGEGKTRIKYSQLPTMSDWEYCFFCSGTGKVKNTEEE